MERNYCQILEVPELPVPLAYKQSESPVPVLWNANNQALNSHLQKGGAGMTKCSNPTLYDAGK